MFCRLAILAQQATVPGPAERLPQVTHPERASQLRPRGWLLPQSNLLWLCRKRPHRLQIPD